MVTKGLRLRTGILVLFTMMAWSAAALAQPADTQSYPNRPVNFIVPAPPGGSTDIVYRLICREAEKFLGQPIVIVNKPGASHTVGIAAIAAAKPDGYTIGYAGHPGSFVLPLTEKLPYHPIKDLKQIIQLGFLNISVTIKGDSPFKTFKDIVNYARENPKKLIYGSAGVGSFGFLAMEQIAKKEKVQFTHMPFKGSPETQVALLGGHIQVGTGEFNISLLDAGQIRLVLLITGEKSPYYPETPILRDLGYDMPAPTFINVAGPKGIPDEIVKKLDEAFSKSMKTPGFIKGMEDQRLTVFYRNGTDLDAYVAKSFSAFEKILKEEGLAK